MAMLGFAWLMAALACASGLDNGAGLTPPAGWSTWCTEGRCGNDYCSEKQVREAAVILRTSGMLELGWDHIILDDCWVESRDNSSGVLVADPVKFPSGMKNLTADLHNQGLKFGLYTSAGNATCNSHGEGHPTPGSEGYYQQDCDLFASWDLDYVKLDWCGDVKKEWTKGPKDYKAFSNALTSVTPNRTMFFECVAGYIFLLGEVGTYCNSWRVFPDHHDSWKTTSETIAAQMELGLQGKPGAWSYMDILTTGGQGCERGSLVHCPGQTDEEYRSEFSLWVLTQSPLFLATDIRNMTAIMKELLLNKEMMTIHQDTRTPPGRKVAFWPCHKSPFGCVVWARLLADGSHLVALYNAGSSSHHVTLQFTHLGWASSDTAMVRDVWQSNTTNATGIFTALVPSHGVALLRVTKTSN